MLNTACQCTSVAKSINLQHFYKNYTSIPRLPENTVFETLTAASCEKQIEMKQEPNVSRAPTHNDKIN